MATSKRTMDLTDAANAGCRATRTFRPLVKSSASPADLKSQSLRYLQDARPAPHANRRDYRAIRLMQWIGRRVLHCPKDLKR